MDINHYKQYEPIFGVWHITRLIGEGSFGKVFELERDDFGVHYKAALKAITIPVSQSEVDELIAEMTDEASMRDYYSTFIRELVEESALMSRLKGNSNIVSYENHQVIEHKDGIGWDVLIQMELLTPLNHYIKEHTITRQDIIKLGIDMCKALELCQKFNIIHRDLKPENIFISESGDFKLGDFGIARTVEKTTGGLSKKGTYNYMAPEVYKGESYGSTVDIYSLGIVLYRLLNENRTPFLPAYPAPITHRDRENALSKRFSGAPLPLPIHGDGRLGEIVLKACSYDSKERYSSPAQMRQELEAILYSQKEGSYIYPEGDQIEQKSVEYAATGEEVQPLHYEGTQRDERLGGNDQGNEMHRNFENQDGQTVSDFGMRADGTISDFGNRAGSTTNDYRTQPLYSFDNSKTTMQSGPCGSQEMNVHDYTNYKIGANYFRGLEAVGGFIFFDESGMTFKSHSFNLQTGETRIAYVDIVRVSRRNTLGIVPNGISVFDRNGFEHKFVIHHREEVIKFLHSKMSQGMK